MIIGITGSRKTGDLDSRLRQLLLDYAPHELHHGDCIGADAYAHGVAQELGITVVVHPPSNPTYRAFCQANAVYPPVTVLPERDYLARNHDIVDACDLLIALPSGPERLRSGTWATVRYARRVGKPVLVLTGSLLEEATT